MTLLFHSPGPRVFALPPGVTFARALLDGLYDRLKDQPPEAIARVTIYVNTQAMQTALRRLLDDGGARFWPRLRTLSEIADLPEAAHLPPARDGLAARLEMIEALGQILTAQPDVAPRAALPDLAESLITLFDEIAGEGVDPDGILSLDMGPHAAHWDRARLLLSAIADYAGQPDTFIGAEARLRATADVLATRWATHPPAGPVLVAGSTASRGPARVFMEAVARLPQGAVILPGVDECLPGAIWHSLSKPMAQDHPQARFARFLAGLGLTAEDLVPWTDARPPVPERNRLVSLALRPAPVTDQWRADGAALAGQIATATAGLSLLEARKPLAEAQAIAMALRSAAQAGKRVALISPDRDLTRQVTAALDRWRITPDDSAGRPLAQSPPGRLLRQVSMAEERAPLLPEIIALLKHPLVCTGSPLVERGAHLLMARELERYLRRAGQRRPQASLIRTWAGEDATRIAWGEWLLAHVAAGPAFDPGATLPLGERLDALRTRAEALCAGPGGDGSGILWEKKAGEKALSVLQRLRAAADLAGPLSAFDTDRLLVSVISGEEVRESTGSHLDIAIWGTLEARVRGADLVILGGLNEGIWPESPGPDPWLNRAMRAQLGLLSPERKIGLSAHDFQQAIAGPEVILSRATRDDEAETVPSRWLNRLQNLLGGLGEDGKQALADMRARGAHWVELAAGLDGEVAARLPAPARAGLLRATRPAPRPPVDQRPRRLSVTEVTTLIRDPYAIYARHVLRLNPVDPLLPQADARVRGNLLHAAFSAVIATGQPMPLDGSAPERLRAAMEDALRTHPVDPAMAGLWRARFDAMLDGFIARETPRAQAGTPVVIEDKRTLSLPDHDFELVAKPDRIDRLADGGFAIFDYKTTVKTIKQVATLEKQLPLQAAMLEQHAFDPLPEGGRDVAEMGYIGVGSQGKDQMIDRTLKDGGDLVADTWDGLLQLIETYDRRATGYRARNALQRTTFSGDYDHLARHGEWSDADPFDPKDVG